MTAVDSLFLIRFNAYTWKLTRTHTLLCWLFGFFRVSRPLPLWLSRPYLTGFLPSSALFQLSRHLTQPFFKSVPNPALSQPSPRPTHPFPNSVGEEQGWVGREMGMAELGWGQERWVWLSWGKRGLSWDRAEFGGGWVEGKRAELGKNRAELGEGWVGHPFGKKAELGEGWVGKGLSGGEPLNYHQRLLSFDPIAG